MRISLIITTYNWKEALALSLKSCLQQKKKPLEIIIADDGSRPDTAELIRRIAAKAAVPVIHSWQEDEGFRLAASRNKAIAKTNGDYIVLIDGDIILERHFIFDHAHLARPGCFVQGTRVLLGEQLSKEVLSGRKLHDPFCRRGVENRKNCLRSAILCRLFSYRDRGMYGVRTCNFAFWRSDALAVNGFNEEFVGWGREDSEFTARLLNYGLIRRNIKFNALAYHLYHSLNDRAYLEANDQLLKTTVEQKLTWCEKGVRSYL
ncbi:glycosyltransferase family 2 protein [Candidatus Electronema sp. PJ]|uniref:glycosyltransferase family 2 protein n=1 Tax=Candidatus Electronema sp. PJ TaxID=3401572 RepID=UPI003AA9A3C1